MAINREEITKVIFNGTRIPAKDFTSPAVDGYNDNVAGLRGPEVRCRQGQGSLGQGRRHQPVAGRQDPSVAYNTDGGNKEWIDAVANNLKNNLGIKAEGQPFAKFAEILQPAHRQDPARLHPCRLAGRLPVAVQLPGPAPEDRRQRQLRGVLEPRVRQAPHRRPGRQVHGRRQRQVHQGTGDPASRTSRTCRSGTPPARPSGARTSPTWTPAGTAFCSTTTSPPSSPLNPSSSKS